MALFKQVKKPVIRTGSSGSEVSSKRPLFTPKEAPCAVKCPLGNDVRGWMIPLAQHESYGRTPAEAFAEAWRQITQNNPFPAVCGRLCQHPCEAGCNRKEKEGAVGINSLERFIGEYGVNKGLRLAPAEEKRGERVAVVGAGPSGLACAYHLARRGYSVTVYDAAPKGGGMMRYGIPRTVLPAELLDFEIDNILQLGVESRFGCVVGQDVALDELRRNYQAVFFAIGLLKPTQLKVAVQADGAAFVGELPAAAPEPAQEVTENNPRVINTVSLAIGQGIDAAAAIDRYLRKEPEPAAVKSTPIPISEMKIAWYPELKPVQGVPSTVMTEEEAIAEAKRCLSCGLCMDCETCWMYCTTNCFVRLPKGEHYKLKLELCNGCGKCVEACPCGYIEMR